MFIFADDDERVRDVINELSKIFEDSGKFSLDQVHRWDCGLSGTTTRGAEFEDNFSVEELVEAANKLAGDSSLEAGTFETRMDHEPSKKVSKVLEKYYYETHQETLSKPKLGQFLKDLAIERIRNSEPRGRLGTGYEFEDAIRKVGSLLNGSASPHE